MYVLRFSESVTSLLVSGKNKWNFQYSTRIFFFILIWWYTIYSYDGNFLYQSAMPAFSYFGLLEFSYDWNRFTFMFTHPFYYSMSKYQFNWMSDINPCFLAKWSTHAIQILVSSVNLVVTNKIQYEFVKSTIWMSYLFVWQYNCM